MPSGRGSCACLGKLESNEAKLPKVREVLSKLPAPNMAFLEYLMKFLRTVADKAETNMMTTKNLAIVFAPNILRPKVGTHSLYS